MEKLKAQSKETERVGIKTVLIVETTIEMFSGTWYFHPLQPRSHIFMPFKLISTQVFKGWSVGQSSYW